MIHAERAQGTAFWDNGKAAKPHHMPLIFIHGLGLDHHCFDGIIAALSATHRVISFDLAGHGNTPADPSERPSLDLFSRQTLALMNYLDLDKAVLIGFSLGGMINRRFAMDYPDRTAGLVVMNSPHHRGEACQKAVEERAKQTRHEGVAATMEATLARWYTDAFRVKHPEIMQQTAAQLLRNDPDWYADCRYVLAAGVTELIKPEPPIYCPSLIITCQNDSGSTVAMSHQISAEIAASQTQIIPDLQHLGLIEAPDLFSDAISQFLYANTM